MINEKQEEMLTYLCTEIASEANFLYTNVLQHLSHSSYVRPNERYVIADYGFQKMDAVRRKLKSILLEGNADPIGQLPFDTGTNALHYISTLLYDPKVRENSALTAYIEALYLDMFRDLGDELPLTPVQQILNLEALRILQKRDGRAAVSALKNEFKTDLAERRANNELLGK